MQQRSIKRAIIGMEEESVPFHCSHDTSRGEMTSAVLNCAFVIMELFKGGVMRYAKKVKEPLHCGKFDIEEIRDNLKSITLYSELLQEKDSQMQRSKNF